MFMGTPRSMGTPGASMETPERRRRGGHGLTAGLRRARVRLVEGRVEGGYAGAFEVICGDCGDHRYMDYSPVPLRLRRLRGRYPLDAGVEACGHHIGPVT